jgi:hypothetical protein
MTLSTLAVEALRTVLPNRFLVRPPLHRLLLQRLRP